MTQTPDLVPFTSPVLDMEVADGRQWATPETVAVVTALDSGPVERFEALLDEVDEFYSERDIDDFAFCAERAGQIAREALAGAGDVEAVDWTGLGASLIHAVTERGWFSGSYAADSREECVEAGAHLSSVDEDGYCNGCGHH